MLHWGAAFRLRPAHATQRLQDPRQITPRQHDRHPESAERILRVTMPLHQREGGVMFGLGIIGTILLILLILWLLGVL